MKAEDYIKQYSDLLIYPKETIKLKDRFSAYRIDFIHTCVIYIFSFTENVENAVESLIKRYKIDIDNQNKFRKIVNSVCRKAQLIAPAFLLTQSGTLMSLQCNYAYDDIEGILTVHYKKIIK